MQTLYRIIIQHTHRNAEYENNMQTLDRIIIQHTHRNAEYENNMQTLDRIIIQHTHRNAEYENNMQTLDRIIIQHTHRNAEYENNMQTLYRIIIQYTHRNAEYALSLPKSTEPMDGIRALPSPSQLSRWMEYALSLLQVDQGESNAGHSSNSTPSYTSAVFYKFLGKDIKCSNTS